MTGQFQEKSSRGNGSGRLDFSPTAIHSQVRRDTLVKPYVLYPVAVAILGGLASILLEPSWLSVSAIIGGSLIGAGSWFFDAVLRKETHAAKYLSRMRSILGERVADSIHNLKRDLGRVKSKEGLRQLSRLEDKYATFQDLLQRKLSRSELTYDRYLGMTEQVYLAGLDNLNSVAGIMQSIGAMDAAHIKRRIKELTALTAPDEADKKELSALQARQELRQRQLAKVSTLLSQNEEAMTSMDQLMAALAEMNSGASRATMDMESAMQELERLAGRAGQY